MMSLPDLRNKEIILRISLPLSGFLTMLATAYGLQAAAPPAVGEKAPDFELTSTLGQRVKLSDLTGRSPVALVVLRGYPGYQCPFCQRQVKDFVNKAQAFADAGVQVVFVYPGPPESTSARAGEFMAGKNFPPHFTMLLDPGYEFTNLYRLRWDAARETAYPSTFLIDRKGVVYFQKISKGHGGRTSAAEIIELLPKQKMP